MMKRVDRKIFIIAEAGVNHNGSLETARKMIDVAAETGADAIKFQTYKAEEIASKYAPKSKYQEKAAYENESQLNMLKKLELDINAHKKLIAQCNAKGIKFLSTPFDLGSIDMLNDLGLEIFKIPSGEITNLPYLRKIGRLRKNVIMSTGMSYLREVKDALCVLKVAGVPKKNVIILHCNTEYPTPYEDVDLKAMPKIKAALGVDVGYSDHTLGIEVPIAAAAMGAVVIEKHFTLDRSMKGPDHKASLEPLELKAMIDAVRNIEKAMGKGIKKPSYSEQDNIKVVRKSLIASRPIKRGEIFSEENIAAKRPGTGISPMMWDKIIGREAKRDFGKDEMIEK